ncbi:MAG: ABC transporter substrate-binding protein [Candidatus Magasanikbacteria bacterium]
MFRKISIFFSIFAAVLLIGAGCAKVDENDQKQAGGEQEGQVKVGVMVPLTGGPASYGKSVKKGIELAHKQLDQDIELVFEDSKCKGKASASAAKKLINVDKVDAIIGELCSSATLAAAPIAQQNKVPMISPASTAPEVTDQGDYIFRVIPGDSKQGKFGAKLVAEDGNERLAVLYVKDNYGTGFNEVLKKEFPKQGGEIVESVSFKKGSTSLQTQLTKIKAANPDSIFIISNAPDSTVAALEQIEELGIEADLYGSEGLKGGDTLKAGDATEGLKITAVSAGSEEFVQAHKDEYDQSNPGPFSAQGYDAYQAIAKAVEKGAMTGPEIKEKLFTLDFKGASGRIKFDENGDVPGNFRVLKIENREFKPVK